jgi:ribonucleoside-diphosphate reductase alpha chain
MFGKQALQTLRSVAVTSNEKYAKILGIAPATAITCNKPSGTVSQLVNCASGVHPRYAPYYIRRVRQDNKDPLTEFLIEVGIPNEPDFANPNATVFSFPVASPKGAVTRHDVSALDQLKLWKQYNDYWCEHKPSVTIYVKEDEWMHVGAWLYENFDSCSGVSFLPYDNGTYRQAPYEEIDRETYERLQQEMPEIPWQLFVEEEDNTSSSQELACTAGVCEL